MPMGDSAPDYGPEVIPVARDYITSAISILRTAGKTDEEIIKMVKEEL